MLINLKKILNCFYSMFVQSVELYNKALMAPMMPHRRGTWIDGENAKGLKRKLELLRRLLYSTAPYGPRREKACLRRFANNKGADQPAHPHSLSSAFIIRVLQSTISKLATGESSIF